LTFLGASESKKHGQIFRGKNVPRKQSATLTEAELRIMNALWLKGPGTVQQVLDWLPEKPALAYNSVLTTVRILERKGYVGHIKDGRAHVYQALVGQQEARRSEIRHLVSRFFRDSHEALLLNILRDDDINEREVKRLREMLGSSGDSSVNAKGGRK
jgi:BlaI family transcriptional regulator, penicillinase repressor